MTAYKLLTDSFELHFDNERSLFRVHYQLNAQNIANKLYIVTFAIDSDGSEYISDESPLIVV